MPCRRCTCRVDGELFFTSSNDLTTQFEYAAEARRGRHGRADSSTSRMPPPSLRSTRCTNEVPRTTASTVVVEGVNKQSHHRVPRPPQRQPRSRPLGPLPRNGMGPTLNVYADLFANNLDAVGEALGRRLSRERGQVKRVGPVGLEPATAD